MFHISDTLLNKLIYIVFLILIVSASDISGQSVMGPYWLYDNHYLTDKFVINPAFSGKQYDPKVFVSTQRMAVSLKDAPAVHIAGAHGRLGLKHNRFVKSGSVFKDIRHAIGGLVFADNNGPFKSIGFKFDYAYIFPLNQRGTTMSLGLGGMLFSKGLNLDKYYAADPNDPLIAANIGSRVMIPDVNAGVLISHDQLYVGLSVSQLLENSYQFSNFNYTTPQVFRNYYLLTGYRLVYKNFELEPSIAAGYNLDTRKFGNNGKFVDLNLEFYLKPAVFTLSYRVEGYMTTSFQYRVEQLELGIRIDLFSTNSSDARLSGFVLMAAYTF